MSRTDKTLTLPTIGRLERALPSGGRALLAAAISAADELGMELWAVGGALRDCAVSRPLSDLDLALAGDDPLDAARLATALLARLGGAPADAPEVAPEPRFGTASVRSSPHSPDRWAGYRLELAVLRSERYARPGALPTVRLGATIEDDLPRRDFTVNALALGLAGPRRGELLDPFGGLHDLARRRLRALHLRSFVDDATRLWRGARYAAALDLRPEPATAGWIADGARWLARISGQRLWAELERTAAQRRVARTVRLLADWGVLSGTHAAWRPAEASRRALRHRPGPHPPALLLALLLAELPAREAIARRLAAPPAARGAVEGAARLLAPRDASPEALAELETTRASGESARRAALWLDPARQPRLQRALRRWKRTRSPLDGRALLRLGVAEGPALGAWLQRLRRERYLGTLSGAAEARRLVRTATAAAASGRHPEV